MKLRALEFFSAYFMVVLISGRMFGQEVKKRNQIILYVLKDDRVKGEGDAEEIADPAKLAGYLMYSWTSLAASITKLAGAHLTPNSVDIHFSCPNYRISCEIYIPSGNSLHNQWTFFLIVFLI